MAASPDILRGLSPRTVRRLRFISHSPDHSVLTAPCRLPGCGRTIVRGAERGRDRWFCNHKCADDFRVRQRALSAAIEELLERLSDSSLTTRERRRTASDLAYLVEIRQPYVAPARWRREVGEDDENGGLADSLKNSALEAAFEPRSGKRCTTCNGTGDMSRLTPKPGDSPISKRATEGALFGAIADLMSLLPWVSPRVAIAIEAEEAEHEWRRRARQSTPRGRG